MLSRIRYR